MAVDLSKLLPDNRKTLNPFGAVAGNREAPAPAAPTSSIPYAPTEQRTPDDLQARIDALSAQNQPMGLPSFTVPDQYANLNPVKAAVPQAPVQSPTTVSAPYSPDVYGRQAQTTFVQPSEPARTSWIKTAKERAKYSILQAFLNDPRQDSQSKQSISDALQSGTSPDEFVTALKSNGYAPQVDENSLAEAEQISKSMFKDEGEAFKRLVNDGMSVDDAHSTINQRWNEALGQTTEDENAQLEKLREDGVSAASAIKNIQKRRIDEKWANEHPFKNFAEGVLDIGAGAASLAMEQVGNVAGFLGSDYGQQFAQETKEATAETGLAGGTGYQTGRNVLGLGESVAAAPSSWATEAWMAKTLAGRAGQGAAIGAYQWAAEPILEKGNEATAEDIATGWAMGAGMGAVAVPVFEKGIQYAGTALSKGAREAGKELAGDVTGMFKKAPEVPLAGETSVEWAATPAEMAAVEKVQGKTAKAVFNGKEVEIQQPETGIKEFVTTPFREKDTKVLAGRAIAPRSVGVNKNPKQKAKLLANTEKDATEFHSQIRSGELQGEIGTLEETAQTIMKNLDDVGDRIGKAIDGLGDEATPRSSGLADDTLSRIDDVLADEIQSDAAAFPILQKFRQRVDQAKTWKQVQAVKKNYQAELNKLLRNNEAGTEAYAALQKGVQDLTKSIEDAVETHLPDAEYGKLKSQYGLLKRLAGDVAQSALVESRRAPQTLVEQLSYLDALTNPLSFAKQQLVKEVAELNTRGGSWKELVKILDKRGIERAKTFKPDVVPEWAVKPAKTEISPVSGTKKPPEEPPTPPKWGNGGPKIPKKPAPAPKISIAKDVEKANVPKVPVKKPGSEWRARKAIDLVGGKSKNEAKTSVKTQESSVKTDTKKANSGTVADKLSDLKSFSASRAELMAEKEWASLGDVNKSLVERGYVLKSWLGGDTWVKTETAGKFKGKEGLFAGIKAKNAPKENYTGWTRESGGKLQFEISDKEAKIMGLPKAESSKLAKMMRDAVDMKEIEDSMVGGAFKNSRDAAKYAKLERSLVETLDAKASNGKTYEQILSDFTSAKTLWEVLDHPELYRQYPELKDVKFHYNSIEDKLGERQWITWGAVYVEKDGLWDEWVGIDATKLLKDYEGRWDYAGLSESDRLKSGLIHEIQHAIQTRENFARGGNPASSLKARDDAALKAHATARNLRKELMEMQDSWEISKILNERADLEWSAMEEIDVAKKEAKIKEIESFMKKNGDVIKRYNEIRNELMQTNKRIAVLDKMNEYQAYEALGGEEQARNAQKRMNLTDKERAAKSPEDTETWNRLFQISHPAGNAPKVPGKNPKINFPKQESGLSGLKKPSVMSSELPKKIAQDAEKYDSAEDFYKNFSTKKTDGIEIPVDEFFGRKKRIDFWNQSNTEWRNVPYYRKTVDFWKEKIRNGERPKISVAEGWKTSYPFYVDDGNHRLQAYKELISEWVQIDKIPLSEYSPKKLVKNQIISAWNEAHDIGRPVVMSSELPSESKSLVEDAKRELKRLWRDSSFMDLPDSQFKEQFGISKSESANMILKSRPSAFRPDERQSLYNGNTEKTARERFNISALEKIGSGSDRDVYQLHDGNVLKIAKTARWLGQNSIAGDYVLDGTVIPHAIEFGDNYVVFEKVTTYKNATPAEKKMLNVFMDDMSKVYSLVDWKRNYDYGKVSEILEKYGWEELMNYDLQDFGFNDVRKANIGIKDWKPILLDEWTVNLVSTLDRYKGVKNLDDPEFRDVYGRSKSAKKEFGDTDKNTMYSVQDKKWLSGLKISSSELPPASPAQELSDAFKKAKDVVRFYQSKDFRKFEQMADEMVKSLPGNTSDMTPEQVKTFRQWNALKSKIRDVYSSVSEQAAKDRSYARDLRADGTEGDLVALHNLGIDKIKKIRELGWLPGPSIGITKKSIPFEDFGDITLVGNRELVESLDAATYDADIYSPRVPSHTLVDKPQYRMNEARKELESRLAQVEKKYPWRKTSVWNVIEWARESDSRNLDAQLLFASENGIRVEPVRSIPEWLSFYNKAVISNNVPIEKLAKYLPAKVPENNDEFTSLMLDLSKKIIRDNGLEENVLNSKKYDQFGFGDADRMYSYLKGLKKAVEEWVPVDVHDTTRNIRDQFVEKWLEDKFHKFYAEIADQFFDKKLFKGFTKSGWRKFEDYNMDNVIREMFKSGMKGTESGQFSGNLSQTLGKNAKKLGLEWIRKMKFDKLDSEYSKLKDRWNSIVGWNNKEAIDVEFNPSKSAEWNADRIGNWFSEEDAQELLDIYKEARKLPRSYIETKFKRAVQLSEFKAVIAPKDKVKELKELLKWTGLEDRIVSYDPATEKRNSKFDSVRKKFGSIFFSQGWALIPAAYVMNEAMKQNWQGEGR